MAAVAGLRGTGDWGTDERPKDFRETILRVRPNGTAPIFGLTSRSKKGKTLTDPEFSWWAEGETLFRLQVNGQVNSTDTLITVDSTDSTTSPGANYGIATHLKEGDVLLVEPSADNITFDHELIRVVSVQSATQFTVQRGAGGTTAATIGNDIWLTVIGSAYAEGTGIPPAVSRNPIKYTNYTQIFKDTYELTKTADVTKTRTGDSWSNDKKRKAFDHSQKIEWSFMFGRAFETVGENGKPLRYTGGLINFIPAANKTIFAATITTNTLLDALSPMLNYSTDAGDTRIVFAGNHALNQINKVIKGGSEIRVNYDKKITMYGLDFTEMTIPRGRFLFYSHPLMSQHPLYTKSAFILDFSAIEYKCLAGRDTKAKDDVQLASEDVRRGFWQTECGLLVDAGGLTQGYLGNVTTI